MATVRVEHVHEVVTITATPAFRLRACACGRARWTGVTVWSRVHYGEVPIAGEYALGAERQSMNHFRKFTETYKCPSGLAIETFRRPPRIAPVRFRSALRDPLTSRQSDLTVTQTFADVSQLSGRPATSRSAANRGKGRGGAPYRSSGARSGLSDLRQAVLRYSGISRSPCTDRTPTRPSTVCAPAARHPE